MLTVVRYITIMLCVMALSLGLVQALSPAPDPAMQVAVASLLSAAAVSALILAVLLRKRAGFGLAAWGTFVLALGGILWAMLVVPGRQPLWLVATISAIPAPTGSEVRQFFHAKSALLLALYAWIIGFSLVVLSAIRRRPSVARRAAARGPLPLFRDVIPPAPPGGSWRPR